MNLLGNIFELIKAAKVPVKRSSKWPKVRAQHLVDNPMCEACGGTEKLEVHHILPFDNDPSLELDPDNLITLCESVSKGIVCHLCIGHAGDYKKYNPTVKEDAARMLKMFLYRRN